MDNFAEYVVPAQTEELWLQDEGLHDSQHPRLGLDHLQRPEHQCRDPRDCQYSFLLQKYRGRLCQASYHDHDHPYYPRHEHLSSQEEQIRQVRWS